MITVNIENQKVSLTEKNMLKKRLRVLRKIFITGGIRHENQLLYFTCTSSLKDLFLRLKKQVRLCAASFRSLQICRNSLFRQFALSLLLRVLFEYIDFFLVGFLLCYPLYASSFSKNCIIRGINHR